MRKLCLFCCLAFTVALAGFSMAEEAWHMAKDAALTDGANTAVFGGALGTVAARCPTATSKITFTVNITTEANYYAWGRMMVLGSDNEPNSFLLSIDDGGQNLVFGNSKDNWNTWHWAGRNIENGQTENLDLGVLAAGEHTISLIAREPLGDPGTDDVYIDVLYLTDDTGARPVDAMVPLDFGIAIDAEKDGWYSLLTGPDDGYLNIRWFSYNNNGKPDDDADLSAGFWAAWDTTYLYVYEEVKDNVVNLNNATSWQNDVLEMYFDPDPHKAVTSGQVGITITALDTPQVADPANYAGITNLTGNGSVTTDATPADYARKQTDDGYVIEARLKWEWIQDATRTVNVSVDSMFGMGIMNHDNDNAAREGSISWATILNDNVWGTPESHGTVKLLADNKVQFIPSNIRTGEANTLPYDGTIPPIMIDAEKDPFYDLLTGPGDGYIWMPHQQYNTNGAPDDDADLSAYLWVSWDDTYMYFYEEVTDNVVNLNHGTSWQDDVLEVYYDPDPSAGVTEGTVGWSLTALDSGDVDEAVYAGVKNIALGDAMVGDYARKTTPDGYTLEARIKWEWLTAGDRGPIVPAVGNIFGMAVMNHDNDDAQREGSVSWATVLDDNVWNRCDNHGTVQFLPEGKLKLTAANTITGEVNPKADWYIPGGFSIFIDAEMDPYYNKLTGPDNGYIYMPSAAFNTNGAPDDDKDQSALLWVAWDETYMYFYEEVADNVVNLNNATSWQNDVLEVYYDPDPSAGVNEGTVGWTLTALDSGDVDEAVYSGVRNIGLGDAAVGDYARKTTDLGYTLEARVKWEWLTAGDRGPIAPAVGSIFGMAVMNHDNDDAQREGSISWATVLDDNVWNRCDNHGTVEFLPEHGLKLTAANAITGEENPNADLYDPTGVVLDVEPDGMADLPKAFSLSQNYPNPFNPITKVGFALPKQEHVTLKVYDLLGREVAALVDEVKPAGRYTITFDAYHFSSGVYIYRIEAGSEVISKKLMLVK